MDKRSKFIKVFNYLIFGNIYIALCAALMAHYTFLFLNSPVNITLLLFIFFASISSYSFHSFLPSSAKDYSDKVKWSLTHKKYLFALLVLGSICSLTLLFYLQQDLKLLLALAVFTVLYSSPKIKFEKFSFFKRFGTAKTLYLAIVWTLVTVSLPLSSMKSFETNEGILLFINRFLLIYVICILFDLKDKEFDIQRGIKSIVTILSNKAVQKILIVCLILFFISTTAFYIFNYSLISIIILGTPGIVLLFLLEKSKTTKSDYWYSFLLDGLMMISAMLNLIYIGIKNI